MRDTLAAMLGWLWAPVFTALCLQVWSTHARLVRIHDWDLELIHNTAIRSPHNHDCRFYQGKVVGDHQSTASVTDCNGEFYGLIQADGRDYILQPHIRRRRDVQEEAVQYDLTGDTVTELEFDYDDEPMAPYIRERHSSAPLVDYVRSEGPVSRSTSGVKGLWLELAIVADSTIVKFHGRDRVDHYILALMNIVSAVFNDHSLNANMTLVINKLFVFEEKDSVIKKDNVKKSLEAVNKWNNRHLLRKPSRSTGWDATVWLTRSVLGGPSGYAPVGGVCTRRRSAAIVKDEGLTSAFVIAHEIGHLLGLHHDEGTCRGKGSVMSPTVLATLQNYTWSPCSKEQFHEKAMSWWCLHERSKEDGVELGGAKEISHYVFRFTMEEQCRTEFGDGYSVCKNVKVRSACVRLWCAHVSAPFVCRSKRASPLEGTPCGPNKWCIKRVCEPMIGYNDSRRMQEDKARILEEKNTRTLEEEKGHWEDWSRWSDCSAECGYGLRSRVRKCRYKGVISERACEGAGSQVAVCWAGAPCASSRDIRADLCFRQRISFIPHIHSDESKQCEIWCMDFKGGGASNFGALPEGSPCSYERPYDVCFQGTCVKGQCNSTDPLCNWCPDGYCNNNTHVYTRQLGKKWTRMMMVPHEAHQLSIHIETPMPLHVAMRERKRDKPILEISRHSKAVKRNDYLKYDPTIPQNLQIIDVNSQVIDLKDEKEGQVVAAGTVVRWRQTETDIFITSTARLEADLLIMAIPEEPPPSDELVDVLVAVNYSTPAARERVRPLEYRWTLSRGPCSVSCGGGVRAVRARCTRDMRCPPVRYEACNSHTCDFKWVPGAWEECSATCGSEGIQERQLYCLPFNVSTSSQRDLFRLSVSPYLCPTVKPDRERPCNRIPCPVYWKEMPLTPCSATCGRGISIRPLTCPAPHDALCGPKPQERRVRCRLRRCPPSNLTTACRSEDTTSYCELFSIENLKAYCVMPPFRKYCCHACKSVEDR